MNSKNMEDEIINSTYIDTFLKNNVDFLNSLEDDNALKIKNLIKLAFSEGAKWADKHPSDDLIKKILDLSYNYATSTVDVTELTEEGEFNFVKEKLYSND